MSPNLLQVISYLERQFNGDIHLDLKSASTYSDHRLKLRKALYRKTKIKNVLNLNHFPNIDPKYVSLSHCPVMGGFVISQQPVGLDLEQYQRLSSSVLKRISKDEEQKLFTENQMKALWTVKESVYKCEKSFESNIPSVKILSKEVLESPNKELQGVFLKTTSEFKGKAFTSLSYLNADEDICLSISFLS